MSGRNAKYTRGSYASLICSNCSSRKTKCRLPSNVDIQPSDQPQPKLSACQRCRDVGLDCIVRATVLGRSALKRSRESAARLSSQTPIAHNGTATPTEETLGDDGIVSNFLLLTIPDEYSPPPQAAQAGPRVSMEKFEALLSPQHLMAAVLSHDRTFGASIPNTISYTYRALPSLVSNGMATLLDEHLAWHRFYLPLTPTLASLRANLSAETVPFPLATATLFALLALLALDTPSNCLREDLQLRGYLRSALSHYGEEFLLTLPVNRHTLAILLLLFNYKISALATSQRAARLAIKSGLYVTLAQSIAQKLGFGDSILQLKDAVLQDEVRPPVGDAPVDIEASMHDVLQFCSIQVYDGRSGVAQFNNLLPTLGHTLSKLESMVETISAVAHQYLHSASIIYHYACLRTHIIMMRHCVKAYSCWNSLERLGELIRSDEHDSRELQNEVVLMLDASAASSKISANERKRTEFLIEMQLEQRKAVFSGLAIFFGLVSSFRHRHKEEQSENAQASLTVHPQQAIQIADDLIAHFKSEQCGLILELTNFLSEFGDDRDARFVRILSTFADAFSQDASLEETTPWLPPPRRVAVELLFYCKILVENSAARIKGWGVLHPMADDHLKVFAACADRLESMATGHSRARSLNEAFADGCLFAAGAKLIRSLQSILLGWKTRLAAAAEEAKKRAETDQAHRPEQASGETRDSLHDVDFDELFTQWSDWPQIDLMDFARDLPDDTSFS